MRGKICWYPAGMTKCDVSTLALEILAYCDCDSIRTAAVGVSDAAAGGGSSCFFLRPTPPKGRLFITDCFATSPAVGVAGPAGSGASEAAGRGVPFMVVPIRMI